MSHLGSYNVKCDSQMELGSLRLTEEIPRPQEKAKQCLRSKHHQGPDQGGIQGGSTWGREVWQCSWGPAKASVGAFGRKAPERHCLAALAGEELFFVGQSEKAGVGREEHVKLARHPGRDWCFSGPVRSAGQMWLLWRGRS